MVWLGPLVAGWGSLMVLTRGDRPIEITPVGFGGLILASGLLVAGWSIAISPSRRRTVHRWLLAAITGVALIAVLETPAAFNLLNWRQILLTRFGRQAVNRHYAADFVLDRKLEFRRPSHARWSGPAASDLEEKWRLPASLRSPLTFTYDRWGFRNPTDLERVDVALIGDSFVDGWYVSDEETVSRRLETRLERPVASLGVAGYGTLQELRVLEEQAPRLKPAVVVWFFFEGNDLYNDARFENTMRAVQSGPPETYVDGRPVTHDVLWRQRSFVLGSLELIRRWSHPVLPAHLPHRGRVVAADRSEREVYFADYAAVPWSDWIAGRWDRARAALAQAAALCRRQGVHLLLCYVPIKFRVYRPFVRFALASPCREWDVWPLPGMVEAFCRSENLPFLDLTTPLQEAIRAGGMPYASVDSHWSPEGHALVADLLAAELRRRGWLAGRGRATGTK